MKPLFNYKDVKNNPRRSTVDLSSQISYTSKCGEILPEKVIFTLPGDFFKLSCNQFSRTRPAESAAFTRINQYQEWYFVPMRLLWRNFPSSITRMLDNPQYAINEYTNGTVSENHPSLSMEMLFRCKQSVLYGDEEPLSVFEHMYLYELYNDFGFHRSVLFLKLAQMLGYGVTNIPKDETEYLGMKDKQHAPFYKANVDVSIFPFLAYQKIYSDYFRNGQWEKNVPYTYNVDFLETSQSYHIPPHNNTEFWNNYTPFDLRYSNLEKDLYHGILPNSQYGDEAYANLEVSGVLQGITKGSTDVPNQGGVGSVNALQGHLKILATRAMQFAQKWKEISISGDPDYRTQIYKHWGVNLPDELGYRSRSLGGNNGIIDFNEVVNTSLDSSKSTADIKGKGIGNFNGQDIEFKCEDYGILMCVSHARPRIQYGTSGIDPQFTQVSSTSYPISEMDSIGFDTLPFCHFVQVDNEFYTDPIGYIPRYIGYKTSVDRVCGDFLLSTKNWNATYTDQTAFDALNGMEPNVTPKFFKTDPHLVDPIFAVESNSFLPTDQLLINSDVQVTAVRNLDLNGLPY